jgi:16S rRNA (guanine966-N2)-methyltransferase
MKQRVREAAFNLVGKRVVGTHVIDLFAGTGALTWEAISRGARSATLIERHFPSARVLRENASALGVLQQVEVVTSDTFFWARKLAPQQLSPEPGQPWLVFCSPPYELFISQTDPLMELIAQLIDLAPPGSCFVVEADQRFDASRLPGPGPWDVRTYPPAVLALRETSDSQ